MERELEDTIEAIVDFFQNNKSNLDVIKPILKEIKSLGYDKPQSISDLDDAKKYVDLIKQLKEEFKYKIKILKINFIIQSVFI